VSNEGLFSLLTLHEGLCSNVDYARTITKEITYCGMRRLRNGNYQCESEKTQADAAYQLYCGFGKMRGLARQPLSTGVCGLPLRFLGLNETESRSRSGLLIDHTD
jgi:hypothetical protein